MVDPITAKLLLSIAAAVFLRNTLRVKNEEAAEDARAVRREAEAIRDRLRGEVAGLRRAQALRVLYSAKNQYVSKANQYWKLKQEFKSKLDILWSDIRRINAMKSEWYASGNHLELPALKAKTNELYSVVEEVSASFREYEERVHEYNSTVAKIKALIAEYSDA